MIERFLGIFSVDMGIDLGTCNTLVAVRGQGIILNEPSVVAVRKGTNQVLETPNGPAVGWVAKEMLGKTPGSITAIRPLKDGVISDFEITEAMLGYFITKATGRKRMMGIGPRVVISIPSGITAVEKRAVFDSAERAGARRIYLLEEPIAAAIGAGLPFAEPTASMIVDIGGGTTDLAIFVDGSVWHTAVLGVGGQHITNDIAYGLRLPTELAESVKLTHGHADPKAVSSLEAFPIQPFGEELPTKVQRADLVHIVHMRVAEMFEMILKEAKRSGYDGLLKAGIVLTGGSSLLPGIKAVAADVLRMPVRLGQPERVTGMSEALKNPAYSTSVGLLKLGLIMDEEDARREGLRKHSNSRGSGWMRGFLRGVAERLLPREETGE